MGKKRKTYTPEFKLQVLEEAKAGVSIAELSRRYEISSSMIYKWRRQLNEAKRNPFPGKGKKKHR